jgi:outer membrane receptor protein involved in Fe transport
MLVDGRFGSHVDWFASFSYLDATFETPFVVDAVNHPFAEDGTIAVARGDRLPLIPRHTWKAGSTWHFSRGLDLIGAVRGVSSSSYRGDEANLAPPLPGYTVADLSAAIDLGRGLSLELVVRNVANASYATFGTFGDAGEVLGSGFDDSRFLSPSEPRSHHIVVSWRH